MHLTITPDGPRGPRRQLAPGCVFLASKLGLPLVAMGFGYDRPWRVPGTWDQFAVPRPGARARAVVSGEIFIPPDLDRDGLEHFRQQTEQLLNRATEDAELWAASGARKIEQSRLGRYAAGKADLAKMVWRRRDGDGEGTPSSCNVALPHTQPTACGFAHIAKS
jgi:hypothetical protein